MDLPHLCSSDRIAVLNLAMHPTRGKTRPSRRGRRRRLTGRGAIGVFVLPTRGIARSFNRWFNKNEHILLAPRLAQSKIDAAALTIEEQALVTRNYNDIVRLGAHARKKTMEKRMRKWFLGDEKAFSRALDELDETASEPALSRTASETDLAAARHAARGSAAHRSSVDLERRSTTRSSPDDPEGSQWSKLPRESLDSISRHPLAYEQRRLDRLTQRSTPSSPLWADEGSSSPPPFSSTDPYPLAASNVPPRPTSPGPTEADTIDTEVMRDLKDMYISSRDR